MIAFSVALYYLNNLELETHFKRFMKVLMNSSKNNEPIYEIH